MSQTDLVLIEDVEVQFSRRYGTYFPTLSSLLHHLGQVPNVWYNSFLIFRPHYGDGDEPDFWSQEWFYRPVLAIGDCTHSD